MTDSRIHPPRRPGEVLRLCLEAAEKDDPASVDEAVSIASTPGFRFSKSDMINKALQRCMGCRATKVLVYLLEQQGVDVNTVYPGNIYALEKPGARALYPFLEVLLAHGWDIDTHGPDRTGWPLLWFATCDPELLDFCLEHGASVYIPGDTPPRVDGAGRIARVPLLEKAAGDATVATFQRLKAKGAKLGRRTLHLAVCKAAQRAPKDGNEDKACYEERVAMVRHLIDIERLDVNDDGGMAGGTPLYSLAQESNGRDVRELIWFLLDRGANPDLERDDGLYRQASPLQVAESNRNTRFTDAVNEWKAHHADRST